MSECKMQISALSVKREMIKTLQELRMLSSVTLDLSGYKDCHEFRFSIVRIVISVSIVTSLQDCLVSQL